MKKIKRIGEDEEVEGLALTMGNLALSNPTIGRAWKSKSHGQGGLRGEKRQRGLALAISSPALDNLAIASGQKESQIKEKNTLR